MKKSNLKKIMVCLLVMMCFTASLVSYAAIPDNGEIVEPQNIAITSSATDIYYTSSGDLYCYADTLVQSGYTAGVVMEIQNNYGGWHTISTVSDRDTIAAVSKTITPNSSYSYRIKVTHSAYTSSGALIESYVTYDTP